MPSVGFQEGSSHVLDAPEPALQVGAVVVRGKGDRRAPCRRAFGNARLVLFALSSEIYRDRSDAERRSLLLRHSLDFVVERNAKMFSAPIPQDPIFLEFHPEGIDREEVSAKVRPVLPLAELVLEGPQGAFRPVWMRFRGGRDFPLPKRRTVEVFFQALHLPAPRCFLPCLGAVFPRWVACASVSDPPRPFSVHYRSKFVIANNHAKEDSLCKRKTLGRQAADGPRATS